MFDSNFRGTLYANLPKNHKKAPRKWGAFLLANNPNYDTILNQKHFLLFLPKSTFQH